MRRINTSVSLQWAHSLVIIGTANPHAYHKLRMRILGTDGKGSKVQLLPRWHAQTTMCPVHRCVTCDYQSLEIQASPGVVIVDTLSKKAENWLFFV